MGLRFRAESGESGLYRWQGNGARGVNEDAVKFMQRMNTGLKALYPDVMLIAEDSAPFSGMTKAVFQNGLGFDYKRDLGWMNDTLKYMGEHPVYRGRDIGKLLFSMEYFFNENYLLPLSQKLTFMGNELAQIFEWDEKKELDWDALKSPVHAEFQEYCRRLNKV